MSFELALQRLQIHLEWNRALEASRDEGWITFEVLRHTGIGMTKEQMGKLFRAFQQADSSTTESLAAPGQGLAISRRSSIDERRHYRT